MYLENSISAGGYGHDGLDCIRGRQEHQARGELFCCKVKIWRAKFLGGPTMRTDGSTRPTHGIYEVCCIEYHQLDIIVELKGN